MSRKLLKTLKHRILSTEVKTNTRDLSGRRLWNRLLVHLEGGAQEENDKENKLKEVIASYRKKLNDLKKEESTRKDKSKRRNEILAERNQNPLWVEQETIWNKIFEQYKQRSKEFKKIPPIERKEKRKENKKQLEKEQRENPLYEEKQIEKSENDRLILERWENKEEDELSRKTWAGELSNQEKFETVNGEFGKSYRWCFDKIKELYKDKDLGFNKYNSAISTLIGEWKEGGKFYRPMRFGQGDVILVTLEEYLNSLSKCEREVIETNLKEIQSFQEDETYRVSPTYAVAICVYPFYTADGKKNMLYQGIHVHPMIFTARRMVSYSLQSPTVLLFQKMKAWSLENSITNMYVCPIGGMVQTAEKNNTFELVDKETSKTLKVGQWNIYEDFCTFASLYKESFDDFAKRIK